MADEWLSIIVPVYNSERYLRQCVASLLNQTYLKTEILLIDDGSCDKSGEICDEYAEHYKNIRVFHQENAGANEARKKGILQAKGSYVAFADSDDWIEADFFERLMSAIIIENADMVTANIVIDTEKRSKIQCSAIEKGVYTKGKIEKYIFPRMVYDDIQRKPGIFAYPWGKIFTKQKLIESISDLDNRLTYGEDGAVY